MADLFERVKPLIADLLAVREREVVAEASLVEDLDADSMDLVKLIEELEKELSEDGREFKISDEDAQDVLTVGDVMAMLERKLAG